MSINNTLSVKEGNWTSGWMLLTLVSLFIGFLFVPKGASAFVIWPCLIVFYICFIGAIRSSLVVTKGISSYLKLDVLFMLFYYVIFYMPYQAYVLGATDISRSVFVLYTFVGATNQSIILSTLALVSFLMGYKSDIASTPVVQERTSYRYMLLVSVCLCLLMFLLFLFTGATQMLSGSYSGSDVGTTTENGIYFLVNHCVIFLMAVLIFLHAENKPNSVLWFFGFFLCVMWSLLLLVLGDRNSFFIIALVAGAGYATFVRHIPLWGFVLGIFLGLGLYNVIEVSRNMDERGLGAVITAVMESESDEGSYFEESSFTNTTVTSRAAIHITPDEYDYFYGKFKFIGIMGIIPYSRSLFVSKSDPYTSSAEVLTEAVLGAGASWSLGSNVVSDIFLDFGVVGVIILMYGAGFFGRYVELKVVCHSHSLKWVVIYLVVLSLYAEMPRYSLDFPVRNIAWTFLLFWVYSKFFRLKLKVTK